MSAGLEPNKPPHAFAVVLFGAAVLFVLCDLGIGYNFYTAARHASVDSEVLALFRRENYEYIRGAVQSGLEMVAAGVFIALLDRLRWLLTPEPERANLAGRYLVSRLGRIFTRRPATGAE